MKFSWPLFRSVEEQGAGQAWFSTLCEEDTVWLRNGIKAPTRWSGVKGRVRNTSGMQELLWVMIPRSYYFPHLGINQDGLLQGLGGGG